MSESSMWAGVRKTLKGLDPVRIENSCELGTPDVNISTGAWVELKWTRKAPKRGGIVKLDHDMTTEQRTWAVRRHHAGGKVFLLLKIGPEYLLFYGHVAAEFLGKLTLEELREKAIGKWKIKINDRELRELLTKN